MTKKQKKLNLFLSRANFPRKIDISERNENISLF